MAEPDTHFARLVSLACHDLRTPLATVHGFARTLTRLEHVEEPVAGYLELIESAAVQLTELLEDLGLVSRIASGLWEPNLQETELVELAREAVEPLGEGRAAVSGPGGTVLVDDAAAGRAVHNLARCALRHGGLERVDLVAQGAELRLGPVGADVAPIILGDELRDLGAAVAVRVVEALGGSAAVEGEQLVARLRGA